jgi:hypothetical protein
VEVKFSVRIPKRNPRPETWNWQPIRRHAIQTCFQKQKIQDPKHGIGNPFEDTPSKHVSKNKKSKTRNMELATHSKTCNPNMYPKTKNSRPETRNWQPIRRRAIQTCIQKQKIQDPKHGIGNSFEDMQSKHVSKNKKFKTRNMELATHSKTRNPNMFPKTKNSRSQNQPETRNPKP